MFPINHVDQCPTTSLLLFRRALYSNAQSQTQLQGYVIQTLISGGIIDGNDNPQSFADKLVAIEARLAAATPGMTKY